MISKYKSLGSKERSPNSRQMYREKLKEIEGEEGFRKIGVKEDIPDGSLAQDWFSLELLRRRMNSTNCGNDFKEVKLKKQLPQRLRQTQSCS